MLKNDNTKIKRILIYRHGSLGDTLVALPCFHAIEKAFPGARRCVLTNFPVNAKACAMEHVLGESGLVDEYIAYPAGVSLFKKFHLMRKLIRNYQPDLVVYLTEPRTFFSACRDYLSFKLFGVKKLIAVPLKKDLRCHHFTREKAIYESEAARLARNLSSFLGDVDLNNKANWDLRLTEGEGERPLQCLSELIKPIIVCSIGTKWPENDWGQKNWSALIKLLSGVYADQYTLVFTGVEIEKQRSQELLDHWQGESLNLCGKLSVRETAVLMGQAKLFLGHDSGPMHLAASQQTPCVAIFSRRNPPGIWFPFGDQHSVLYPTGKDIFSILPNEVLAAIKRIAVL